MGKAALSRFLGKRVLARITISSDSGHACNNAECNNSACSNVECGCSNVLASPHARLADLAARQRQVARQIRTQELALTWARWKVVVAFDPMPVATVRRRTHSLLLR
jgi:hypothetical protein